MSTPPPAAPNQVALLPPEQRFWRRYSPHREAPLSGVGSLTLHVLVGGILVLGAFLVSVWGDAPATEPPIGIEPVPGNGGGGPGGPAPAHDPAPREAAAHDDAPAAPPGVDAPRPDLPNGVPAPKVQVDLDEVGRAHTSPGDIAGRMGRVNRDAKIAGAPAPAPRGKGGNGTGESRGPGPGTGPAGALTVTQKRMLRWTLRFDTRSGQDYVRQLQALGAVLAIPRDRGGDYQYVRDLSRRPVALADADGRTAARISWRDEDPRSIAQLMQALGLNRRPARVEAYFPESLEQKLSELERDYAHLSEDEIDSTVFDVVRTQSGYAPRVARQTPK